MEKIAPNGQTVTVEGNPSDEEWGLIFKGMGVDSMPQTTQEVSQS